MVAFHSKRTKAAAAAARNCHVPGRADRNVYGDVARAFSLDGNLHHNDGLLDYTTTCKLWNLMP